jgi:predicted DNA-binding protein
MKRIFVRFADKEYEDLVKLSKQLERSMNVLIREAVRQCLERRAG